MYCDPSVCFLGGGVSHSPFQAELSVLKFRDFAHFWWDFLLKQGFGVAAFLGGDDVRCAQATFFERF